MTHTVSLSCRTKNNLPRSRAGRLWSASYFEQRPDAASPLQAARGPPAGRLPGSSADGHLHAKGLEKADPGRNGSGNPSRFFPEIAKTAMSIPAKEFVAKTCGALPGLET